MSKKRINTYYLSEKNCFQEPLQYNKNLKNIILWNKKSFEAYGEMLSLLLIFSSSSNSDFKNRLFLPLFKRIQFPSKFCFNFLLNLPLIFRLRNQNNPFFLVAFVYFTCSKTIIFKWPYKIFKNFMLCQ